MDEADYPFGVYDFRTRKLHATTPSYEDGFKLCMKWYAQMGRTFYVAELRPHEKVAS